ncbi:hypothetical protein D0A37_22095 [Microcoleus vaginatus HSN003]|nr:hypothetical protein D0A37_22095 [Microcoleus vaginatus HSN003]
MCKQNLRTVGQKPGFLSGNLFESVVFGQETRFLKVFVGPGLAIFLVTRLTGDLTFPRAPATLQ